MKEVGFKKKAARRLRQGAAIAGVAAAGYTAGRAASITASLSDYKRPYDWKPGRGKTVFLKGPDIVDVKRGQTLRERGLLFKDGQITEIVSTRGLDKVEADHTFDLSGMTLIPGLINSHCHALMPGSLVFGPGLFLAFKRQAVRNLEECPVHGVTTVRDAGSCAIIFNRLGHMIENLELLGPRCITSGPSIMARGGYPEFARQLPRAVAGKYGDLGIYVTGPESARHAVRTAVEQGARFIKIFFDDMSLFFGHKALNTLDDESVTAIIEEAHRLGRRVAVHQTQLTGFRRAVRLGVDDLEHIPSQDELTDEDVAHFMKGNHHLTPTGSVSQSLAIAPRGHPARENPLVERMQLAREEYLHYTCPTISEGPVMRANLKMVDMYENGSPGDGLLASSMFDNEQMLDAIIEGSPNIMKMYRAGAKLCCGNDGGTPLNFPATIYTEMEIMDWLGIPRPDILKAATLNGAGLLDLENEIGSLEEGKLADIVALSGNPLDDVRSVRLVEGVFRSGILLHRGERFPLQQKGR